MVHASDFASENFATQASKMAEDAKRTHFRKAKLNQSWFASARAGNLQLLPIILSQKGESRKSDTNKIHFSRPLSPSATSFDKSCSLFLVSNLSSNEGDLFLTRFLSRYVEIGLRAILEEENCHSFILHDTKRHLLILWKARTSIENIYTHISKEKLIFSPTLSGILSTREVAATPCKAAIAEYLYFGFVPHDACLLEGIHKIAPGQALIYDMKKGVCSSLVDKPRYYLSKACGSHMASDFLKLNKHSSCEKISTSILSLDPLEKLWQLQEPRYDLWQLPSSELLSKEDLLSTWIHSYQEKRRPLYRRKEKPSWPNWLQNLATYLKLYGHFGILEKRFNSIFRNIFYRPIDVYMQEMQTLNPYCPSFFDFSPHIWLQEHLELSGRVLSQKRLSQEDKQAIEFFLFSLSSETALSPLWIVGLPKPWQKSPWPWYGTDKEKSELFGYLKSDESLRGFPPPYKFEKPNMPASFWIKALHALSTGILIDESLVSLSAITALAKKLLRFKQSSREYEMALKAAHTLLALEMWLRIFIDHNGTILPDEANWQKLLGLSYP